MTRCVLAAVASVWLGLAATPVAAQIVAVPASPRAEQAARNAEQAMKDAERITALAAGQLSDPRMATATTPEAFAALVEPRRADLAAARTEVQAIRDRLLAMPPAARPSDPPQMRLVDQTVLDVARMAGQIDDLMANALGVADGVKEGDRAKVSRSIIAVATGTVVLTQAQAVALRAKAATLDEGTSNRAQLAGLACLSEGIAAFQQGLLGMAERPAAAVAIRAAQACTVREVASGRAALDRETAPAVGGAAVQRFAVQYEELSADVFDQLDRGSLTLGQAAESVERGASVRDVVANEFVVFQDVMTRVQRISAQQAAAQAAQMD
ncbi:MAG: hypothetical protein EON89_05290 [Brevundimonas sp.]|nr:MAG: hypothetical protein EON89_05290 [Brevundimonas sp.]